MSNKPKTKSLESILDELSEMERIAQAALLKDKKHLYTDASSPKESARICEQTTNGSHEVYLVDVNSVQKYLDDIGNVVDLFHKNVPSHSEYLPPQADLRFLEVCGDVNFPYEDDAPYKIRAKCAVDFSYSRIKCPIELVLLDGAVLLDLNSTRFEFSFEVQISNESYLDIVADKASFEDDFIITSNSLNKKQGYAHLSIRAPLTFIDKRFICQNLIILYAILIGTGFKEKAVFRRTRFKDKANFTKSRFLSGVLFEDCYFTKAPDFHEAVN